MIRFLKLWQKRSHDSHEGPLSIAQLRQRLDPIRAELLQTYTKLCMNLHDRERARKLAKRMKAIDLRYARWVRLWKEHATWDDMTEFEELDRPYLALVAQANQVILTLV